MWVMKSRSQNLKTRTKEWDDSLDPQMKERKTGSKIMVKKNEERYEI